MSTFQSVVALVAGLSSIVGGAYSMVDTLRATPATGDIIADVRDADTAKPVQAAIVEILRSDDTLVTTMTPGDDGLSRRAVAPGTYRVRVVHPDYVATARDVHVLPDGTAELRLAMERKPHSRTTAPRPTAQRAGSAVADGAARAINRGVGRVLGRIGF